MTVRALTVPEPEPYISRPELARRMGVGVDTVDALVKQGMPSETWGVRRRVFRASVAIAWAREHAANSSPGVAEAA